MDSEGNGIKRPWPFLRYVKIWHGASHTGFEVRNPGWVIYPPECTSASFFSVFFKMRIRISIFIYFFNLKIMALQNFVVFCQTSTWISRDDEYIHEYIHPCPCEPSSHLPSHLTPRLSEFPEPYSKFSLAIYHIYGNVSFHVTLSIHLILSSPLPMSISLFSMFVSPLLPCKQILQYHFSRFCIYALEYDIYLSDSLHSV